MRPAFFTRIGIFFIPSSLTGWGVLIAALAYCVELFIDIDSRSHSVSDTLMNFAFNAIIVFVMYSFIAFSSSAKK